MSYEIPSLQSCGQNIEMLADVTGLTILRAIFRSLCQVSFASNPAQLLRAGTSSKEATEAYESESLFRQIGKHRLASNTAIAAPNMRHVLRTGACVIVWIATPSERGVARKDCQTRRRFLKGNSQRANVRQGRNNRCRGAYAMGPSARAMLPPCFQQLRTEDPGSDPG